MYFQVENTYSLSDISNEENFVSIKYRRKLFENLSTKTRYPDLVTNNVSNPISFWDFNLIN